MCQAPTALRVTIVQRQNADTVMFLVRFLKAWDTVGSPSQGRTKDRVLVLGTTTTTTELDDRVLRRMPHKVRLELPALGERE